MQALYPAELIPLFYFSAPLSGFGGTKVVQKFQTKKSLLEVFLFDRRAITERKSRKSRSMGFCC
jgi:hypothetical protein